MNFIKILLFALGLILFGMIAVPVIAFVWHALWYLFWIALIGIGGYVGYKWLTKDSETKLLEDKSPFLLGGVNEITRSFKDFKRKNLMK